jgi:hypothetical protein
VFENIIKNIAKICIFDPVAFLASDPPTTGVSDFFFWGGGPLVHEDDTHARKHNLAERGPVENRRELDAQA